MTSKNETHEPSGSHRSCYTCGFEAWIPFGKHSCYACRNNVIRERKSEREADPNCYACCHIDAYGNAHTLPHVDCTACGGSGFVRTEQDKREMIRITSERENKRNPAILTRKDKMLAHVARCTRDHDCARLHGLT